MKDDFDSLIRFEDPRLNNFETLLQKHMRYGTTLGELLSETLMETYTDKVYCLHCRCWKAVYQPFDATRTLNWLHPTLARVICYRG